MAPGHQRPPLAHPDPLPGAERLPAEPPPPPGTPTEPPPRQEAVDATGAVRVVVDARARVESVQISNRWRDRLDPDALLAALLETHWQARQRAMQAFVTATRAARRAGDSPPDPTDRAAAPVPPQRSPDPAADRETWLHWLADLRANTQATRERTARIEAATSRGPRDRTGPHGYLRATVQGEVTAITGDARAIWRASTEDLQRDALAILAAGDRPAPE